MSLIERAAGKIPGRKSEDLGEKTDGIPKSDRASTIETLMERAALAHEAEALNTHAPAPPAAPVQPSPQAPAAQPAAQPAARASATAAPQVPAADRTPVTSTEPVRIHLESLRARGFVTPEGEQQRIGQEFRVIKRPLLKNAFGHGSAGVRNGRRVMVTSAFPSEGKTFCAINLAMSIAAERDCQVLLVDADVARPALMRELGISATAGLMDCLIDGTPDVSSLVLPTNVDKLSILPAGRRHGQSTELLASDAMTDLLDRLSESYPDRILVFDSPPLLLTTEARVLAGHMGQVVLVVEATRTPQNGVAEALATIQHCEVVGLVLNKARVRAKGYYSGYDSGYGGYGYADAA